MQKVHQWHRPPSFAFPSQFRFSKLSRKEVPDGRGRTFVPDHVSTRIRFITKRHLLFPSSQTRTPIGSPCGSLSCKNKTGGIRGFHVPHKYHSEQLRFCPSTGDTTSAKRDVITLVLDHLPFWLEPISIFGSACNYGGAAVHMVVNLIALS